MFCRILIYLSITRVIFSMDSEMKFKFLNNFFIPNNLYYLLRWKYKKVEKYFLFYFSSFLFFSSSEYSNGMFLSVFTKALMHIHGCHLFHLCAWCPEWNLEGWVHRFILLKLGLVSSLEYLSTSVVPSLLAPTKVLCFGKFLTVKALL